MNAGKSSQTQIKLKNVRIGNEKRRLKNKMNEFKERKYPYFIRSPCIYSKYQTMKKKLSGN